MIVEIVSIGYGVVSMVGWGFGDFIAKRIVAPLGYYRLLLYIQLVGLAPLFLLAAIFTPAVPSSPRTIALILATGICSVSALFFFYKGLTVGKASIITPVASTSAIVAIALSFAILGETLSLPQIICIALVLAGILVVSMRGNSERGSGEGVPYAVACMFSAGLNSILIKLVSMDIGEIGTLFFNRVLVTLILLMLLPFFGNPFSRDIQRKVPLKTIVTAGLTEFAGFFGFIVGIGVGIVSIIAPISSASPAVTVVLAQVFLKERLIRIQKVAVVSVILGIALLSILSSV